MGDGASSCGPFARNCHFTVTSNVTVSINLDEVL